MSFISDFLFGDEGTPSTVQDIRSPGAIALNNNASSYLTDIFNYYKPRQRLEAGPGSTTGIAAPITGNEQDLLQSIQRIFNPDASGQSPLFDAATQQLLLQTQGGGVNPIFNQGQSAAAQLVQDLLSGKTLDPASNPALGASIKAAQQPILELFGDQLGDLRGQFTAAGQFVNPGSSSPFETAKARLQTGLANALGTVSSNLVGQNLQNERNRQVNVLDSLNQSFESGQNRQLNAATQVAPFTQTQLTSLISGLEASALPRLVEQYGIDEGQRRFETQQAQLLNALIGALNGTSTQPVVVPGTEGSGGVLGGLLPGIGTGVGTGLGTYLATALSDIRLKKNIRPAGVTEGGNLLFTWDWVEEAKAITGSDKGFGVIAQLIKPTNPDAVIQGDDGYYRVNYSMVA